MLFRRFTTTYTIALAALAGPAAGQTVQERVDLAAFERIREEGLERSRIDELAGHLTDVIGPRLTGSPAMRRANEWTAQMFREWGLANVVIEPWGEFGRGWERVSYSGRILTPFVQPLTAQPIAWTGSTRGAVEGPAVVIEAETVEALEQYRGKLRNAFVLMDPPTGLGAEFERRPLRASLDDLIPDPLTRRADDSAGRPSQAEMQQRFQAMREAAARRRSLNATVRELAQAEGAAAILQPSARNYGILRAGGGSGRDPANPIPLPELVLAQEQYGQIYRNVKRGVPVRLEVDVQNRFFSDDLRAFNTLADLPGTDRADEYVMIGAHLDSWHTGTGATDNAAGSVVMMEAMRILKALDLKPRRTIRIALWSGEEQGLLGSRYWVENNAALGPRISAYLNVDNGTGRIRGIWNQSNEAALPIFEQILWPFRDLGVVAVRHGNTGGTDHLSFDRAGIPGFNFIQDPIEYGTRTHHTNADVFDHLVLDDLRQAAVVVAATAYHIAMRDELMPRKPAPATLGADPQD